MHSKTEVFDWHGAASQLVKALVQFDQDEERVRILEKLCFQLGDQLYPALLQILLVVEKQGDLEAKQLLADTLAQAVYLQRLPTGKLNAWGSSTPLNSRPFTAQRSLGPIEFLCCWYAQPTAHATLSAAAFHTAITGIISLVNSSERGCEAYQNKILADTEDPLTGALTMQTRSAMKVLANSWKNNRLPPECAKDFIDHLANNNSTHALQKNPFV